MRNLQFAPEIWTSFPVACACVHKAIVYFFIDWLLRNALLIYSDTYRQ